MSINLLEKVQQNLGYPALQKIDPNTQKMVVDDSTPNEDKFSQAAIPAVLISLCKYVQTDIAAKEVLANETNKNWVSKIFDDNSKDAVETIAAYAKQSKEEPITKMNCIANEAIKITKESIGNDATIEDVKTFFDNEKSNILLYLPAALHLGVIINNETIDDSTNKMEGPVSSLMQTIGSVFDSPTVVEDIKY
jgi:S-adenosylmethionine hydrolase